MFNALPEGAKDAVLSNIEVLGQAVGKENGGSRRSYHKNFQELVKHMSDAEREALIEAVDRAQREELKDYMANKKFFPPLRNPVLILLSCDITLELLFFSQFLIHPSQ